MWQDTNTVPSMPGAATSQELGSVLRSAMVTPPSNATLEQIRELTRRLVYELRVQEYEPQAVLLHVKEILQRASLGVVVDDRRLIIWKRVIDWTIGDYYRAD